MATHNALSARWKRIAVVPTPRAENAPPFVADSVTVAASQTPRLDLRKRELFQQIAPQSQQERAEAVRISAESLQLRAEGVQLPAEAVQMRVEAAQKRDGSARVPVDGVVAVSRGRLC